MKAAIATDYGSPNVLQVIDIPQPVPADNEILIKIHAASVTVMDSRSRSFTVPALFWLPARLTLGLHKPRHPILGVDLAGEVQAMGRNVSRFQIGDKVFGSCFGAQSGAHAEYKCLPADGIIDHMPANLHAVEAAAVPLGANTALYFLQQASIQSGQHILINGASGSVGTYAVQIAKYFGATVTAICGTRNIDLVRDLGADHIIDYTQENFLEDDILYDVVLDTVGNTTLAKCQGILKANGYYVNTVMVLPAPWHRWTASQHVIGGTQVESQDNLHLLKELLEKGKLKPVIDQCYPLDRIIEAHHRVDSGRKVGNVVVTMPDYSCPSFV